MKISWPDPKTPPSLGLQRGVLLSWASLLLPFAIERGVSWNLAWAIVVWAFCAGVMTGFVGRQNKVLAPVTRGWDNFVSACFLFVIALGFTGMVAFSLLRDDEGMPLWWLGVAVSLAAAQTGLTLHLLPDLKGYFNRGLLLILAFPFLVWFHASTLKYLNGAFDFSEVRVRRAVVVSKGVLRTSKGGPSYLVRFQLSDGTLAKSRVTSQFYDGISAGQALEVHAKSGALGAPWIVEVL